MSNCGPMAAGCFFSPGSSSLPAPSTSPHLLPVPPPPHPRPGPGEIRKNKILLVQPLRVSSELLESSQ